MQGICKWFNETKGFGFINSNNCDYFVHYKNILGDGFKTLHEGDRVEFDPETSPKGEIAKNVKIIEKA